MLICKCASAINLSHSTSIPKISSTDLDACVVDR